MPNPRFPIGLASGQDAWLTVELESVRFTLEIGGRRPTVESLAIAELKTRLLRTADLVAQTLAGAIRADCRIGH
jgi:hypothetical protein